MPDPTADHCRTKSQVERIIAGLLSIIAGPLNHLGRSGETMRNYGESEYQHGDYRMTKHGLVVTVSADVLCSVTEPYEYDPWFCGVVTRDYVRRALKAYRLRAYNPGDGEHSTKTQHAEHIAYLVAYGWKSTDDSLITLEFVANDSIFIYDGNHRLHALAYLGATWCVDVSVSGFLDPAEELLGIKVCR